MNSYGEDPLLIESHDTPYSIAIFFLAALLLLFFSCFVSLGLMYNIIVDDAPATVEIFA